MAGLLVFRSLGDALDAGYQVYDRTNTGYLVRTRTPNGWACALVQCGTAASHAIAGSLSRPSGA